MQINRLFEIVYILLDKKSVTAGELAERFEVSKRTILRDIDALAEAGIPVYTSQGKGGGISILETFVLNKTTITGEEQDQILFALQSLSSTWQVDTGNLLSRLRTLFEKTDTDWIEVDFSRWGSGGPDKEKFELLKRAIIQKHAMAFTYSSSYGETTERTVYPLKLLFRGAAWYLKAYCLLKKDHRVFKINRMQSVEVLQEVFSDKDFVPWSDEQDSEAAAAVISSLVRLELKFAPQAAYRVFDEFDIKDAVKNADGSFIVEIEIPEDQWLYGFLLSFGPYVEVLSPDRVKKSLVLQAGEIKNLYKHNKT
jgi:predicted DNA-binding transcriptional regulator YafY